MSTTSVLSLKCQLLARQWGGPTSCWFWGFELTSLPPFSERAVCRAETLPGPGPPWREKGRLGAQGPEQVGKEWVLTVCSGPSALSLAILARGLSPLFHSLFVYFILVCFVYNILF